MLLLANRPNPFSRVEPQASHTTFGMFLGMGQTDELDLLHPAIYTLEVMDCQVRPFLLQVLQDEPPVAMVRFGLAAKKNRGHGEIRGFQMILNMAAGYQ